MTGDDLPVEVEDFLLSLRVERGRSANTLKAYANDLRAYVAWLDARGLTIGEVDAVYGGVPDGYVAINVASGAPLADSYPSHPAAITGYTSIMSDAPHPYAARLFQEWAATPESAALFSETSSTYPLNSEVEDQRAVTKEPWYTPVSTVLDDLWVDWALDSDFVAATQPNSPWITKFNTIMGITN